MTAWHTVTTRKVAATIGCRDLELFGRFNNPDCLRMILAHERKSIANSIMSAELFNDAGPNSIIFVLHQRGVTNDEHSVLRSRKKDICAIG